MIKIAENYAIGFDKWNVILHEQYEKRSGRGRDAPLSGEFAWRELGYFRNVRHLGNHLIELELKDNELKEYNEFVVKIEKLKEEIIEILEKNITVEIE